MSFIPTPFTTPVIAPFTASAFRSTPYISPSEYRFAPTAVATNALVAGSTNQAIDSLASLSQVISRASGEIDTYCFHRGEGTLAASVSIESGSFKVKPDGSVVLICNFKPILQVVGVMLGPGPAQLVNMDSTSAQNIIIGNKTIILPGSWNSGLVTPNFSVWPSVNGMVYASWSYINGWPNIALSADATAGQSTITVTPASPGGTSLAGIYANTQLTIHDGSNTEVVVSTGMPTGLTIDLAAPLAYNHTVPTAPDFLRVSAIPWAVEQATISLTSFFIKAQGNRAQVLGKVGTPAAKQAAGRAGASDDYETALKLLEPFRTTYIH